MSGVAIAVGAGTLAAGYLSSKEQAKAAGKAAAAQERVGREAIAEERRQFDAIQEMLQPFVKGGQGAFAEQLNLIGLGGPEAQQQAIQAIEMGPQFKAMVEQGEQAILQSASATGGLRGGNTQAALAQYRPQVLNQLVDSKYAKLGDISRVGQASAVQTGAAGQQMAGSVGQQLGQIGQAQAQNALIQGQANAAPWQMLGQLGGMYLGSKF